MNYMFNQSMEEMWNMMSNETMNYMFNESMKEMWNMMSNETMNYMFNQSMEEMWNMMSNQNMVDNINQMETSSFILKNINFVFPDHLENITDVFTLLQKNLIENFDKLENLYSEDFIQKIELAKFIDSYSSWIEKDFQYLINTTTTQTHDFNSYQKVIEIIKQFGESLLYGTTTVDYIFSEIKLEEIAEYLSLPQNNLEEDFNSSYPVYFDANLTYDKLLELYAPHLLHVEDYPKFTSDDEYNNFLFKLGKFPGWSSDVLAKIRSQTNLLASSLTKSYLLDLGYLSPMLTQQDIAQLNVLDLDVLEYFSKYKWANIQKNSIMNRYMRLNSKNIQSLSGPELVIAGDLLCGVLSSRLFSISSRSFRYSFSALGKIKCFDKKQLLVLKTKAVLLFGNLLYDKAMLNDLGVIAGGFDSDDFTKVRPIDASILSPNALSVASAEALTDAWNVSHYALMGMWNGLVLIARPEIFMKLNNLEKNAVFRSAFGSNAAYIANDLQYYENWNFINTKPFKKMMQEGLSNILILFDKVNQGTSLEVARANKNPSSLYGLNDPTLVKRIEAPEFAQGIARTDFEDSFDEEVFKDRRFVQFLNKEASNTNKDILQVMQGSKSFDELKEKEIKKIPPLMLEGMKSSEIQKMSGTSIAALLDSDLISRDPASFIKTLRKMSDRQFKDALSVVNDKMLESYGPDMLPWRPPITTQKAIVDEFMRRMSRMEKHLFLDHFLTYMCPFVAGISPKDLQMLPVHAKKVDDMLECFQMSYEDLSDPLKDSLIKWTHQAEKSIPLARYGKFILDVPLKEVQNKFKKSPSSASDLVLEGYVLMLDPLHKDYERFINLLLKILVENNKSSFDIPEFVDNLGHAACELPLDKLKRFMSKKSISHLALFVLEECEGEEEMLSESLEECKGGASSRLQRCKTLKEKKDKMQSTQAADNRPRLARPNLNQFNMMRELADTIFEEKDLSKLSAKEMEESAGALSGLKPTQLDTLPKDTVLQSLSMIKKNKNLSPRQKRIVLDKARSAGMKIEKNTSISSMGELVTEIKPDEFKMLSPQSVVTGLSELKSKATSFNPRQKKAIVEKLEEISVDEILKENLGELSREISLDKLSEISSVNMSLVKDQSWDRGQAAKLVEIFMNGSSGVITTEQLSEMGSTISGLKCSDVMNMYYDEILQNSIVMSTSVDLYPDMNECIQSKLDFSMQILHGVNYTRNDTSQDLASLLKSIPADIIFYYSPSVMDDLPNDTCLTFVEKLGTIQLDKITSVMGKKKRSEYGEKAIDCLLRVSGNDTMTNFTETEVSLLGGLVCDIPANYLSYVAGEAFTNALSYITTCIDRFDSQYRDQLLNLTFNAYGSNVSTWDNTILDTLGPVISLLRSEDILQIDSESFLSSFDTMLPPEDISIVNYQGFYTKALLAVRARSESFSSRRRRAISLSYDDFVTLGPANSLLSPEELAGVAYLDLINSLDTLGAINNWSEQQCAAILGVISSEIGSDFQTWPEIYFVQLRYILQYLNSTQFSSIPITLDVASSISSVPLSSSQSMAVFERYLEYNNKSAANLTGDDLIGLGSLLCGASINSLTNVPPQNIRNAMKNIGEVSCFNQSQFDVLYTAIKSENSGEVPDAALIQSMGNIAVGMPASDWSSLPLDTMPFITSTVFDLIDPERIRDGIATDQLATSGITNIGVISDNTALFETLTSDQQAVVMAMTGRSLDEVESTTEAATEPATTSVIPTTPPSSEEPTELATTSKVLATTSEEVTTSDAVEVTTSDAVEATTSDAVEVTTSYVLEVSKIDPVDEIEVDAMEVTTSSETTTTSKTVSSTTSSEKIIIPTTKTATTLETVTEKTSSPTQTFEKTFNWDFVTTIGDEEAKTPSNVPPEDLPVTKGSSTNIQGHTVMLFITLFFTIFLNNF